MAVRKDPAFIFETTGCVMGKQGWGKGDYLEPLTTKRKSKRNKFAILDIESKDGDTQRAGFTRPFLSGFYDPHADEYIAFRNEPHLAPRKWDERAILPGGNIDKLMTYCLCPEFKGWIFYAHNGGNFDFLHLVTWLQNHKDEYGMEIVPVQSSIQILRVWQKPVDCEGNFDPEGDIKYRWEFLDSMKLLPMGLEKACKAFGVPGKHVQNLDDHEEGPFWESYLEQDCRALAQVMLRLYSLVEDKLGGEVGVTTPSTSVKLFRRQFQGKDGCPEKIARYSHWPECKNKGTFKEPGTCDGCAHAWILRGYYGGRTEIFRTYGEGLKYYDFNSSYVASMKEDMPIGKRVVEHGTITWARHRSLDNPNGKYAGFCECTVYIPPDCEVPPLPYRSEVMGKLIFPTGRFSGVWSIEELKLLEHPLVKGTIEKIVCTVWFQLQPMFKSMVNVLWRYRDKDQPDFDEGLSLLAKLLGNGGYGKFAMKKERMSVVFAKDRDERARCSKCEKGNSVECNHCFLCDEETSNKRQICQECQGSKCAMEDVSGDVWYKASKVDAVYIIPHISSHITASARVRLWHAMAKVIELGGKLYYCDTDSIICNLVLESSTRLGELKDEYPKEGPIRFLAVQPKVYMIEFMELNAEVDKRLFAIHEAVQGKEYPVTLDDGSVIMAPSDCSTYDKSTKPGLLDDAAFDEHGQPVNGRAVAISQYSKVTMKGFPQRERTKENLAKLRNGETLEWKQLEKIRTLARGGFRNTPKMRDVKKSFQSRYDKRVFLNNGDIEGPTRAVVIGVDELENVETAE